MQSLSWLVENLGREYFVANSLATQRARIIYAYGDAMAANLGHVLVCRRGWHFIGNYINLNGLVKGLSSWWKQRFCDDIKHILRKWKQPFNRPQSRCRRRWYRITTQSHTRHSVSRWHCHDSYLAPRLLLCLSFHYLLLPLWLYLY